MKTQRFAMKALKGLLSGLCLFGLVLPALSADDPGGGGPPGGGGSLTSPGEEVTGLPILVGDEQPHTSFEGTPEDVLLLLQDLSGRGKVALEMRASRLKATLYGNLAVRIDRDLAARSSVQIRVGTRFSSSTMALSKLSSRVGARWSVELAQGSVQQTRSFAWTGRRVVVVGQRTPQQSN